MRDVAALGEAAITHRQYCIFWAVSPFLSTKNNIALAPAEKYI